MAVLDRTRAYALVTPQTSPAAYVQDGRFFTQAGEECPPPPPEYEEEDESDQYEWPKDRSDEAYAAQSMTGGPRRARGRPPKVR